MTDWEWWRVVKEVEYDAAKNCWPNGHQFVGDWAVDYLMVNCPESADFVTYFESKGGK